MRTRKVIAYRPANIPPGWEIHNAPRPLGGHETWQGDFVAGPFYAAVDPAAADYAVITQRNAELDATRLLYVTEAEAVDEVVVFYQSQQPKLWEKLNPDVTDPATRAKLVKAWYNFNLARPEDGDAPVAATIEVIAPYTGERQFMQRRGVGAYPYDCTQRDKHPTAVIYRSDPVGWVASVDLAWSEVAGCYVFV